MLVVLFSVQLKAQTIINAGNLKGTWAKKGSPYLIKGDVNIAPGDLLTIKPGVKIVFMGNYLINVQGSLYAVGSDKEKIMFTSADSSSFAPGSNKGWGGIHFDKRPFKWDTCKYSIPDDPEIKEMLDEQIRLGSLDTTLKITLTINIPDQVNDTALSEKIFRDKTGSRLEYCQLKYGMAAGRAQPYVFGGAVYIYRYSNLLINNCAFENNFAYAGGAIYCKEAAPMINNCTVKNCKAESSGGAMVFIHSGPVITGCKLLSNGSGYNGGGILLYESTPYITGNTLLNNKAFNSGGGLYAEKKVINLEIKVSTLKFQRDTAFENKELKTFSLQNITSSYGRYLNNIICNNRAMDGGGVGLMATSPELINNTISNNLADSSCGGIYCNGSSPTLTNSIIYANKDNKTSSQVFLVGKSAPGIKYCNIELGNSGIKKDSTCKESYTISNIISTAPNFVDPLNGNFALSKGSKCIDAGMVNTTTTLKIPAIDLSGKNRVVNNTIDLGAIEYNPALATTKKDTLPEPLLKSANVESDSLKGNAENGFDEMYTVVYPNPTHGMFSVTVHNNKYKVLSIRIYSHSGQIIYNQDYKTDNWFEQVIDLSNITPGVYIVLVSSNENLLYNGQLLIE